MRILHISYTTRWGAGKSLLRLHQSFIKSGLDSHILVADRSIGTNERVHRFDRLAPSASQVRAPAENATFSEVNQFAFEMCEHICESELFRSADVVELRQLHAGRQLPFFDLKIMPELGSQKPLVWRLSDAWAFTGACVYPYDCSQWQYECAKCPFLEEPKKTESRISKGDIIWNDYLSKRDYILQTPMHVVCPSQWLLNLAKRSILRQGREKTFHYIPVGVDTKVFSGRTSNQYRNNIGFSDSDVVLLINAPDLKNYRKGSDHLLNVLKSMETKDLSLLVIGSKAFPEAEQMFKKVVCTGYLDTDKILSDAYAAADIFLFPSRQDNSAQVLLEASASGLPVVAFDTGGNSDYVRDRETGFLVPLADTGAFAQATNVIVQDRAMRQRLGLAGQYLMRGSFTMAQQTNAFVELYKSIIN